MWPGNSILSHTTLLLCSPGQLQSQTDLACLVLLNSCFWPRLRDSHKNQKCARSFTVLMRPKAEVCTPKQTRSEACTFFHCCKCSNVNKSGSVHVLLLQQCEQKRKWVRPNNPEAQVCTFLHCAPCFLWLSFLASCSSSETRKRRVSGRLHNQPESESGLHAPSACVAHRQGMHSKPETGWAHALA